MKENLKNFGGLVLLIVIIGAGYGGYQFYQVNQKLKADLTKLNEDYAKLTDQNKNLITELQAEQDKNKTFSNQIGNIASTVGKLEKLKNTDPELLAKYSKIFFLNENYYPTSLSVIDPIYIYNSNKPEQILTPVLPHLRSMLEAAKANGAELKIVSAYRSFTNQATLKTNYKVTYGTGANKFSADQGYSEHQLGTTIDLTTPSTTPTTLAFEKTAAYEWLTTNAYKYGFTLSYPKGNAYYQYEPWHWRFVGVELATKLHNNSKFFYDLDQREIDNYLVNLFD